MEEYRLQPFGPKIIISTNLDTSHKLKLLAKWDIYREWILHELSETTPEINDDGLNQLSRQGSNSSTDLHEVY
uniref:Uncharacterized protein n=1 Tax=Meloidogyne floridensis TaxID=298350 RepID=A0A915PG83_9BILA